MTGERAMAWEELAAARTAFLTAIDGLTDAQWRFRAEAGTWSIAEIAEHVALVAESVTGLVRGPLLATAPTDEPTEAKEEMIRRRLPDRSRKVSAPDRFMPVGPWSTREAVAHAYARPREELLAWLETTDAPLRGHRLPHFRLGMMDGVEWLVFLAAHDQRHVAQIAEVKRAAGYPA